MIRAVASALVVGVAAAPGSTRAQVVATPTIPATRAGTALHAWLDAVNSGDTARVAAYYRRYQPELIGQPEAPFRREARGFELLGIEHSGPRRVEFVVRQRSGPTTGYGVIEVSADEPLRVTGFPLYALGPNAPASVARIDAAARARVIEGAIAQLDSNYVFPEVAARIGDSLRARLARGAYDEYGSAIAFGLRLANDLREVGRDKHLGMAWSAVARPAASGSAPSVPTAPPAEERARRMRDLDEVNCGFVKAEWLPGNVGYLKFDIFASSELCGATGAAAMSFLAGTRALVVDLRDNGGGDPAMVAYLSSYLFSRRTHLNDLWERRTGRTQEFWTRDDVPGRKFGGEKPIYVLTSSRTFSGAEEFAYNLKSHGRAVIVGETSGGGAHPVWRRRIDDHFSIGVPGARAINPVTRTNWEGVGVEPDVKVPSSVALSTALRHLNERLRQ